MTKTAPPIPEGISILECTKVGVTFDMGRAPDVRALVEVDLRVTHGSVALVGPSGSGKTTLLRCIAGLQAFDGSISIGGHPVRSDGREMDSRVSLVPQSYQLVSFLNVRENLELSMEFRGVRRDAGIGETLARVGLAGIGERMPDQLSGGQRQRVALARAVLVGSHVLLADEPTGSLDADNAQAVARLIAQTARSGDVIAVVATHDPLVAAAMDWTVRIKDGRLEW